MTNYEVKSIGRVNNQENEVFIIVNSEFIPALKSLDGFSHVNILWWFSDFDNEEFRSILETKQPYKDAPETMGIFATRSPIRPNPIALSTVKIVDIDYQKGIIKLEYIDANNNSPVLDIKPYTPSFDRVEIPTVPEWCSKWPKSLEKSEDFNWEDVFTY